MSIWFRPYDISEVIPSDGPTIMNILGIEVVELGSDYLKGKMPVDERHLQPEGYLHGGASMVLAESLGSLGASLVVDPDTHSVFGLEINANHIQKVRRGEGFVYGLAKPAHLGKSTQVWEIRISNENRAVDARYPARGYA